MKIKLPLFFIDRTPEGEERQGVYVDAILDMDPFTIVMICPYLDKEFKVTEMTEVAVNDGRSYVIDCPIGEFIKFYQDTFGEKFKELKVKGKE